MPRARKPKAKEPPVPLTPEQKKIRRQARAEDRARNPKTRELPVDFDWSTVNTKSETDLRKFVHRCSVKCERASENAPMSPTGNGAYGQYKNKKGKLRWMCSYVRRSERDEMLRESKKINGRKAKKESKREE